MESNGLNAIWYTVYTGIPCPIHTTSVLRRSEYSRGGGEKVKLNTGCWWRASVQSEETGREVTGREF